VTGSWIPVILRLLPQTLERLQCWYYWWGGFMKYVLQMASGRILNKFHEDWYRR
jgi:hypothetical protein